MDIIMLALPRWDGPYSSTAFSLAKELSRKNRVFYVDNPFTIKDVATGMRSPQIKRRLSALLTGRSSVTDLSDKEKSLICVTPPPMIPINFLSAGSLYDLLSSWNDRIFFNSMKSLISRYGIKDFIFINVYNPFYGLSFPSFFRPQIFLYYSVDNIGESRYVGKHGPRLETAMMKRADAALTTSRELWKQARRNTSNAYYLPNAADIGLFIRKPHINIERPLEFKSIKTPIIIYTGHIDVRLDYDLVEAILKQHRDKLLVMVGPRSIPGDLYERLNAYPNIMFTGARKLSELPSYLHYSQCAIIPFKCNELTRSIYPLKVNEYLAAGLPVVSTSFSEDIQGFGDVIEIAGNENDFCRKIDSAISSDKETVRNERIKVASGNNWEDRTQRFWDIVGKFINVPGHLNSMAPMS